MRTNDKKKRHGFTALLIIINDFAHDLFTGFWVSSLLVIFLLNNRMASFPLISEAYSLIHSMMKMFFWLGVISILLIIATGIIRLRNYRKTSRKEIETVKTRALIVKHLILTVVFLAGTYFAYYFVYL